MHYLLRLVLLISAIISLGACSQQEESPSRTCAGTDDDDHRVQFTAPDERAKALNLDQAWESTMPCSGYDSMFSSSSSNPIHQLKKFMADAWAVRKGSYFYGPDDVSFVPSSLVQPSIGSASNSSNPEALRVLYKKGSYSPVKTSRMNGDVTGGTAFYMTPFDDQSFRRGLLQYDVAFADNFDWVKGGKLPGIYGGDPASGCSGGNQADGVNCFSVRIMWRKNGEAEAYAYLPSDSGLTCNPKTVICNSDYGTSLGRGRLQFQKSKWSKIEIYTELNDIGQSNGVLKVWQDSRLVIDSRNLTYRHLNSFAVSSIMFNTFYGGSTPDYAATSDTYTYYKNIRFSVAQPETLVSTTSLADSSSRILSITLLFMALFSNIVLYIY